MKKDAPGGQEINHPMKCGPQFGAIFCLATGLMEAAIAQPIPSAAPLSKSTNLAAACVALGRNSPDVARRFAAILDAPTTILSATIIHAGGNGNAVRGAGFHRQRAGVGQPRPHHVGGRPLSYVPIQGREARDRDRGQDQQHGHHEEDF